MPIIVERAAGTTLTNLGVFNGPAALPSALTALRTAMSTATGPGEWFVRVQEPMVSLPSHTLRGVADQTVYIVGGAQEGGRTTVSCSVGPLPALHFGLETSAYPTFRVHLVRLDLVAATAAVPFPAAIRAERGVDLVLDSCSLSGSGSAASIAAGVQFDPVPHGETGGALVLENCLIERFVSGVVADGQRSVHARDSAVLDCTTAGRLTDVGEVEINDCQIGRGAVGLDIEIESPNATFELADCRFLDVETGVLVRARRRVGALGSLRRCEFAAPSEWTWDERFSSWNAGAGRARGVVLQVDVPGFRPGFDTGDRVRLVDASAGAPSVGVFSSVFHMLDVGVQVQASAGARLFLDHNTYALCRTAGVRVSEGPLRWEPQRGSDPRLGGNYAIPSLIVSNSLFIGGRPRSGASHGGIELGHWPAFFFPRDPLADPERNWILIAANSFSGFAPATGSAAIVNRIFERTSAGTLASRFGPGDHAHFATDFVNQTSLDPALARPARLVGGRLDWDYHPINSLGSQVTSGAFDFVVSALDASGRLPLLALWGYPGLPRRGFYGNQPVVPQEVDPLRRSIGAAEPVGWEEFPIYGQFLSAFANNDPPSTLDQAAADTLDIVSFPQGLAGALLADAGQLTGDPAIDAPFMFQMDRLTVLATAALRFGLKVTGGLPFLGPPSGKGPNSQVVQPRVLLVPDGQGLILFPVQNEYLHLEQFPNEAPHFLAFVRAAALEYARAIRGDPVLSDVVAWWWMPEEIRNNAFGAGLQSGGGRWEYPACLQLRSQVEGLGPPYKPFFSFQSESASSYGGGLPGELAGGVTHGEGTTITQSIGESLNYAPGGSAVLWSERFNDGVVAGGVPVSVGRPDPIVAGGSLGTSPPDASTGQFQVSYHFRLPPNPRTELTPPLDALEFRAAHLDGLFPGNYVDRDLFDQRPGADLAPLGAPVPGVLQNRILIYHRLRSLLEARDNARWLVDAYSQSLSDRTVHHMVEVFQNVGAASTSNPSGGRLWPETPALAAHDLLIGLAEADGVGLYNYAYTQIKTLPASGSWLGMSGANLNLGGPFPTPHPGWEGYEEVLRLIKGTLPSGHPGRGISLREFLVAGDRDFDLGFQITAPQNPAAQIAGSQDYGLRSGWVGIADYQRLNHWSFRLGDLVALLITHSDSLLPSTFEFCDGSRFPNATVSQLLTAAAPGGGTASSAPAGSPRRFAETISGIEARVYLIALT